MIEYGIFNDEGLVEGGFYDQDDAEEALENYEDEDDCHVAEICPDHEGQERHSCEECSADGDDDDSEPNFGDVEGDVDDE